MNNKTYVEPSLIERISPHVVRLDYHVSSGDTIGILCTADHHFDNPKCNRDILEADHQEAVRRKALIIAIGDIFCAMQGRGDFRGSKSDVRPENMTGDYLGSLVRSATEFYSKYAQHYLMMSPGNHEDSVLKRMEFDLLSGLVANLNLEENAEVHRMPYMGWIFVRLFKEGGGKIGTIKISYHHGYGGGGPVTKDVIQTNRKAVYLPDADYVLSGHTHDKWEVPIIRERINHFGDRKIDQQVHIKLPTYKEEYLPGKGFHIAKGRGPKPLGGAFLELQYHGLTRMRVTHNVDWTWHPSFLS